MLLKLSTLSERTGSQRAGNQVLLLLTRNCSHTFGVDYVKESTKLEDSFGI